MINDVCNEEVKIYGTKAAHNMMAKSTLCCLVHYSILRLIESLLANIKVITKTNQKIRQTKVLIWVVMRWEIHVSDNNKRLILCPVLQVQNDYIESVPKSVPLLREEQARRGRQMSNFQMLLLFAMGNPSNVRPIPVRIRNVRKRKWPEVRVPAAGECYDDKEFTTHSSSCQMWNVQG